MEDVGKILPAVFKNQIRRAGPPLVELLTPLWPRVAGKAMARCSRPAAFENGTLTLECSCLSWTAQLRSMSEEVRATVNGFLGVEVVRRLTVRHVPSLPPSRPDGAKPLAAAPPALEKLSLPDAGEALNPEISAIVERSFAKYFARRGK